MNLEILTFLLALKDSSKQLCSAVTSVTSALEVFNEIRYINLCFTYLLTYERSNRCKEMHSTFKRAELKTAHVSKQTGSAKR